MKKVRVALLISGGGTTAEAVILACQKGIVKGVEPVVVISSRAYAFGITRAKKLGIPTRVVSPKKFATPKEFGQRLLRILKLFRVDVVSQNGWLPLTPIEVIKKYKGKIMNQHPGPLDPGRVDFGGKGMYGKRVTCARLAYAWMKGADFWTEATTHVVTEEYDKGVVVKSKKVLLPKVAKSLSFQFLRRSPKKLIHGTNTIAQLLLSKEHANVIATLQLFVSSASLPKLRRKKPLINKKDEHLVELAKQLAIELFPKG